MGVGMGMQAGGSFMGAASATNMAQMQQQAAQQQAAQQQTAAQQQAPQAGSWTCECGTVNTGKFCSECGKPKPQPGVWTCGKCGTENTGKFCSECGSPRP